MLMSYLH